MTIPSVRRAMIVPAVALAAGCGLTGSPPDEPPVESGHIALAGTTRQTQSVSCTQIAWDMTIQAVAAPGRAHALLQLGGRQPVVKTVDIRNIDGSSGVAGFDFGTAKATADGTTYTITGTAVGSDPAEPGRSRTMPFEIKAPC
ncbi:conserved lipoprotein/antigen [Mycolicibacterium chubuense NBB4]|uniref:Conserved lipoprotein/antigen n=1 Tax=Mycolicibacterium chubuense (strain NBB4) TaxID=710421 RepID=I4BF57_MYCCN|nr:lipoprotein LpqH [Mycolicibacterium chubuense]AFM15914.1 conserved lipoprotein/antigen [Mycolicibacterium chubuense NBB4]